MAEPDDLEARVAVLEDTVARLIAAQPEEVEGLHHGHDEKPKGKSNRIPRVRARAGAGAGDEDDDDEEETKEEQPQPEELPERTKAAATKRK